MKTSKKLLIAYSFLVLCFLVSLTLGRYDLNLTDILSILAGRQSGTMNANIFYNVRLVRSAEVVLCGMALAVSGYLYQSCFHNPLVSPDTLGVSGGASIGAIIAILYLHDTFLFRQAFSFLGGIIAVVFSLFLSRLIGTGKRAGLLLAGIITGALANSAVMAFKYLADPTTQLAVIDYWLMGSFSLINRRRLLSTAVIVLPALFLTFLYRFRLKALLLDEEEAQTLGISIKRLNRLCITLSTLLTAASVSVSGIVSWIGLLTPHIVSLLFRSSFEETLLLSMPVGAAILLLSDTLARTLTSAELPVSIITSSIGAIVLFVFLLTKRKGYL
ncbi:MAG: iron ABC transporter permease [Erysipelotrichaceae bacterium]|nr:iron ABC transporter permease [Erysipelotrichaceae bacterium]